MWEQTGRLRFTENVIYIFAMFSTDQESKCTGCRWQGFGSRGGVGGGELCAEMPGTALGRAPRVAATPSCFLLAPQQPQLILPVKLVAPLRKYISKKGQNCAQE